MAYYVERYNLRLPEEFEAKMNEYKNNLAELFAEGSELEKDIHKSLEGLGYGKNG